jgi:hypothetical protein|uniref:Uncharacterized protein n=1 Tax=viral metagenome TaxID=1070528 RepID=A0A6C0JJ83_9ZZZZ
MALILLGITAYIASTLIGDIKFKNVVPNGVDEFHIYSGVHPELYKEYLKHKSDGNIRMVQETLEELALHTDIEFREQFHQKILKKQDSLSI